MEVGSEVKDFKVGDKVVSTLNTFVSNGLILSFCMIIFWVISALRFGI